MSEILADDIAGDNQMTNMLRDDDERRRDDDENSTRFKSRRVESRQRKPGSVFHHGPVYQAAEGRKHIAADDAKQDGDNGEKALEGNRGKNGDGQCSAGNKDDRGIRCLSGETCHACSSRHQLQADDGDDGAVLRQLLEHL